jgi:hypothetical protein
VFHRPGNFAGVCFTGLGTLQEVCVSPAGYRYDFSDVQRVAYSLYILRRHGSVRMLHN